MILITDCRDKTNLLKFSHLKWVFIGSHKGSVQLKNILDENNRTFVGKDIENVVDLIRDNFIDYLGQISQQQSNKTLWYSSRMASKSIQTSMFHQYVYLKVLEKFLESRLDDTLVVSDDKEFLYNTGRIFSGKVEFLDKRLLRLKLPCRSQYGYIMVVKQCIRWFLFRFFRTSKLDSFNVFIHSWIDERVFRRLPYYNDSYFNELEDVLKRQGYSVGRLAPLRVSLRTVLKLNRYFNNIVYPLAYVTLGDFLKIVFTKFRVTINNQELGFIKDIEILNHLLENEIRKENKDKIFLEYLLFFSAYRRINLEIKGHSTLIYPFENQPWEKMFNLAFARFNKIAYQHSTIPFNWLDFRISQYEDSFLSPKIILTTGPKWATFLKSFYRDSTIEIAGALRFSYLLKEKCKKPGNNQSKNIVIALDMMPNISITLQMLLLAFLEKDNLSGYTIKIKPHQYLPKYACFEHRFINFANCKFVSNNMSELLKDCSLLIVSNSSVVFESALLGIKTLYFIPEEPSLSCEHFIKESLFMAYEENFSEKFQEALQSSRCPEVNIEEYFSPPDYSAFLKYLKKNHITKTFLKNS